MNRLLPDLMDKPSRILIVDDEPANRDLLEAMLTGEGYDVVAVGSGEQALAFVADKPPDLMLLDIMMPGMDGYQVAANIKNSLDTSNIPIIMITVLDDRDSRVFGLRSGAEDFLTRPVDRGELCMRVRNLLRLKAYGDYYGKYSEMLEGEVVSRTADLLERTKTLEQNSIAMRRTEERTNYALGAAGMGVWEVEIATQRLTWSETLAPLFGLTPDQAPTSADGFFSLIHPDDRKMVENWASAALGGTDCELEFRVVLPDGSVHWQAGRARVLAGADGKPARLIGSGMDVSARKLLEAQYRQAQKMEAVGLLAGGVAHDFNNLLTVILGYSNFVVESFAPEDERNSDMQEVLKAGKRAAELVGQLLAFSRKQVLRPTAVDLNGLVTGMGQMLGRLIGEDIELVTILAPDLGAVLADTSQLEQILMNLVINARDAMPSGGRLAVETANVELDQSFMRDVVIHPGSYVMLAVSDSGTGMDEATKQRLFEPFFTTKEIGKGTGLGLATVYGIVKQSAGYVWVYSELGKGATFKVYLPQADAPDRFEHSAVRDKQSGGTETVLIVEDDDAIRAMSRRILEGAGYTVFDAPNPRQAEALFEKQNTFTLLVTDVIMPGSSGPKLFEALSRMSPGLRVLYVSGYTDDTIVHQGQLDPGVEFLQKPFTSDALTLRVREILDR
ncbi:MAG: response regulator [Gemmatimonadales bacterium]